jgi:putative OPT family oligopeptide transporter
MADLTPSGSAPRYRPYVPVTTDLQEFTTRAVIIGLVMCVVLGAANAYLGLKAGMTIAATYPAAVIGMAVLRLMKGSILEENIARTVGSIGESVAAGAVFTIPALYIAGVWTDFAGTSHYIQATLIMLAGGVLGIMFVALLRRVMVEDVELPFPESVAASEIHKAGRTGGTGAAYLFGAMGVGAAIQGLVQINLFQSTWQKFVAFAKTDISLRSSGTATGQSGMLLSSPSISPAFVGVGYIIGPKLASLNFAGGVVAWGLMVPILSYFIAPTVFPAGGAAPTVDQWIALANNTWFTIVRPIAIGGMLVSAAWTLFRMRNSLVAGIARSVGDVKKAAAGQSTTERTEQDVPFNWIMIGIAAAAVLTFFIYNYFTGNRAGAALVATLVLVVAGFFFAAVSGYLVGIIGSSNNPVSGLTLSTLVIAALLMVALGMTGQPGVAAVLGVAGVVCVSSAVGGEMLQDLKVGHILGGTPWKMQIGDLIGVAAAAAALFIPLVILHQGDINAGHLAATPYQGGFGGPVLPAPQASLMALLSQGIVGGHMAWPLIIVGAMLAIGMIMMQVRSPMLVFVGMYINLGTTFAIFVGGAIRGIVDWIGARRGHNAAQKARTENNGILLAAGLIAGEALIGLLFAALAFGNVDYGSFLTRLTSSLPLGFWFALLVLALLAWLLIQVPLNNAGSPDEPAPPSAVM